MIKRIPPEDYSIRAFKAYKLWQLNQSSDGIGVFKGTQITGSVFDDRTDPTTNGEYKRLVYEQIRQMYYDTTAYNIIGQKGPYENNIRYIGDYCNVISIPTRYFGEEIKPGSVTVVDAASGKTLIDDGFGNLVDNSAPTVRVGNVIYPHGMIISTIMSGSYTSSFTSTFDLTFRSSLTIYEHEIFLEVKEDEFNVSQNPTAYIADTSSVWYGFIRKTGFADNTGEGEIYYNLNYSSSYDPTKNGGFGDYAFSSSVDPTGSYLAPYVTTIGLYNDDLDLVAVAKLTNPLKSYPDLPINFIIRFDI